MFIMIHRNNQDYITAFVEGYICAIIGERMTIAKVSEAELDNAKLQQMIRNQMGALDKQKGRIEEGLNMCF